MILQNLIGVALVSVAIRSDGGGVQSYSLSRSSSVHHVSSIRWRRPSMVQLRQVVRSWQPLPIGGRSSTQLASGGSFYDDFEDFGDFGSNDSNNEDDKNEGGKEESKPEPTSGGSDSISASTSDDAVMRELRERMSNLSKQSDNDEDDYEDEDEDEDEEDEDDMDSGSALPDLEGNTLSSIDDLIGFAQAKAREKAKERKDSGKSKGFGIGGTWEDENWARPVDQVDEETGDTIDLEDLLEGGVVLIANPAKFCSDLAGDSAKGDKPQGKDNSNKFLGGLFDDPFPTSQSKSSSNSISPALLAKFGITLPPSPDLGPDRRADLLPVVLLIDRDPVRGCQAVLMNRRTGNLMGDLPPSLFQTAEDAAGSADETGFSPHPLSAFMIQPLWWAGSSPGGNAGVGDEGPSRGGGIRAIDMVHACPYVNGSVPLAKSDGLYWGGSPVQAQEAMKDDRLEKPLSGFDFKFFIQTTRWLPSQLEQEIEDGVWYLATVSKEVLFRSRDRLGAKRAKPLWTEIIELLGDDYQHIRDQLYGDDDDDDDDE